ncbi:GNAT family N-acetyltransferase [Enterococcus ratti]|uniref:GNAT family acetyltransferase n=1 Tax=Enterococcus ratti TaxID=150033 RepID=A0A1L8WSA3_9ENTE|nr:GNAT family N-acetyltransferase [Enterococcus ratti]OJG83894.1 GNAT family acetyltransferase [Enterococcus ratti]
MIQEYFGNQEWIRGASFYLRYQVFVLEQGISPKLEFDEKNTDYHYFLLMNAATPVATLRYKKKSAACFQPDRFCVAKDYRHQGFGSRLLLLAEEKAKQEGFIESYLVAEKTALEFYSKQGYQVCTKPFIEDGLPCVGMKKQLIEEISKT